MTSTANSVGTKGEARSEPDMAGVVERLTALADEMRDRDEGMFCIRAIRTDQTAIDLRALLSAFKARGEALSEIVNLPNLSRDPVDDFDRGARAARLDASDIANAALHPIGARTTPTGDDHG